jgi:large subunit ribosomal protein L9
MKVILKDDIEGLGNYGDTVNVAPGYARNYLIPRKLAMEATEHATKLFEMEKAKRAKMLAEQKAGAEQVAAALSALKLTIKAKTGDEGKLFGSVTSSDIASALAKLGHEVDRKKIHLAESIKALGSYTVEVKVHPEVTASIPVEVISE